MVTCYGSKLEASDVINVDEGVQPIGGILPRGVLQIAVSPFFFFFFFFFKHLYYTETSSDTDLFSLPSQ